MFCFALFLKFYSETIREIFKLQQQLIHCLKDNSSLECSLMFKQGIEALNATMQPDLEIYKSHISSA